MKTRKSKLIFAILLCTSFTSIANSGMPPPGLAPAEDSVDATINQNIFVLMFFGVLLGLFFIMSKQRKTITICLKSKKITRRIYIIK